jgi:hypothetical protein
VGEVCPRPPWGSSQNAVLTRLRVAEERTLRGEKGQQRKGDDHQSQQDDGRCFEPGVKGPAGHDPVTEHLAGQNSQEEQRYVRPENVVSRHSRVSVEKQDDAQRHGKDADGFGRPEIFHLQAKKPPLDEGIDQGGPEGQLEMFPDAFVDRGDERHRRPVAEQVENKVKEASRKRDDDKASYLPDKDFFPVHGLNINF